MTPDAAAAMLLWQEAKNTVTIIIIRVISPPGRFDQMNTKRAGNNSSVLLPKISLSNKCGIPVDHFCSEMY